MTFEFFGNGNHKITVEKALELYHSSKAFIIDVRSPEEVSHIRFDFSVNIPVSEFPDRMTEIPKDKKIIIFCSSIARAAIVYMYLRVKGYNDVKILGAHLSEIANCIKPGYVLKTLSNHS